jgi:glycosyltransferase involved in cell wall biosynthesis
MRLTGVVIAKDEEKKIAACLKSLSFCDEVIVIDSGSSDNTIKIAQQHHAKIYTKITTDFSDLRNFALKKASGNWVFYVDADEQVTDRLVKSIEQIMGGESPYVAFKIKRKNYYFGKYEWPYIEHLERLFSKRHLVEWYGKLHESPRVDGEVSELDGFLLHYTHDDLSSMIRKTNQWSEVEAKTRYYAHHPKMTWWRFPRVMVSGFWNSYIVQGGWKVGTAGLVESIFQAYSMFVTYAKLWELQNKDKE